MKTEAMYAVAVPQEVSESRLAGTILRWITLVLLGLYAAGHAIFVPTEVVGALLCADPVLVSFMPFLILILALKYVIPIGIYMVIARTSGCPSAVMTTMAIMVFVCLAGMTVGMHYIFGTLAQMVPFINVWEMPYFYDYIGCVLCGVFGIGYMVYLSLTNDSEKKSRVAYYAVPVRSPDADL